MTAITFRSSNTAISATALGLSLAFAGAAAADNPYEAFQRGVYLPYLDAQGPDRDITRIPHVRASFGGGPAFGIVMDTGSTGIVVSAHRIPNIDSLPSLGPGHLTYTSSGRIMIGRRVVTAVTVIGADGARLTTGPIPVLAVTQIRCTARARNCRPNDNPRHVSMMGIGFGRGPEADGGKKNPFLNVATIAAPGRDSESAQDMRRGYIVTRHGVHVGLTGTNTKAPFNYVTLERSENGQDWAGVPVCMSVDGAAPAACGRMLMDTGVTTMYLALPDSHIATAGLADGLRGTTLIRGTKLTIATPTAEMPQARYTFTVGDLRNPMAPRRLVLLRRDRTPFVNTSLHFLNGFDYLFDADGGRVGFRAIGRNPATGRSGPPSD